MGNILPHRKTEVKDDNLPFYSSFPIVLARIFENLYLLQNNHILKDISSPPKKDLGAFLSIISSHTGCILATDIHIQGVY